ncbi:MAG TPA: hypothetical protein VGK55_05110, partial [Actinomycetes bacterium]
RTDGDEQLKQVRWHVEEQSRSAERAVFDARRSGANVPPDLTALALAGSVGGAPTALAPADGVGERSNGESPRSGATNGDVAAANGEAGKPASAARSRDRISTGA